jgi:hypothetical protein
VRAEGKQARKCKVKIDRVVLASGVNLHFALELLVGFTTVSDHALKNINKPRFALPYGRVREMVNAVSKTKLFINYSPRFSQLPALRVKVVPDDASGMHRQELEKIFEAFAPYEYPEEGLRVVEVAIDFSGGAIGAKYIRRHLIFGKCRIRPNIRFPKAAWFGVPGGHHFVRCYRKHPVNAFRVEEQCNRGHLQKHGVETAAEIIQLPQLLVKQLGFFQMNWNRLSAHVRRRPRYAEVILRKAHDQEECLHNLLRFLRTIGISNPRRFLVPLAVNSDIQRAVLRWNRQWMGRGRQVRHVPHRAVGETQGRALYRRAASAGP